ncbi:biosynthetic peptidoglycan transglycosylase [Roseinatronobacter alkalisoli]|uniref:Transglycosylase domain-containing protein n=1 Tax=Roseinatronobacter alkalisoli TaxID=3028235 RepID=A0ABT5T625_9RHOB|nr:biosynthetic peptidoglycan transglycosylase [Roseinatronobacter sp. HJB301]MDD7970494.1 transglycosylase domain-containing protein [Roseinatronobacter sp. HJB301]
MFDSDGELSNIEIAILTLEDRRFFYHFGVELRAIPRLLRRYFRTRKIGGISTIEQQVVRIVTTRYERSARRKIKEILISFFLNFHVGKREILHFHLNASYFGYGLSGCNSAAKLFFGKEAEMLGLSEASILSACLPVPCPRILVDFITKNGPFYDSESLLKAADSVDPRWVGEMRFRSKIVLSSNYRVLRRR